MRLVILLFVASCTFQTMGTRGSKEACLDWVDAIAQRMRECNSDPAKVDAYLAQDRPRCDKVFTVNHRTVYEQCIPDVVATECGTALPVTCDGIILWP